MISLDGLTLAKHGLDFGIHAVSNADRSRSVTRSAWPFDIGIFLSSGRKW